MSDRSYAPPLRLRLVIREYLSSRRCDRPVSIARLRDRVRCEIPDLTETDDVLGEMIAAEIIENGGNVRFDGRTGR